jgi:hypothetical protein
MSIWSQITAITDRVPPAVWIGVMMANILVLILTWGAARRRLRQAGQRAAYPEQQFTGRSRRRDVALTVASLVPAALFWAMVLAGSFHGLIAFGRNTLDWNDGSEYLVPGTLDGVSVTFGFLAFRAVHKRRDPARSQRVVWAASLASATVNFAYEYGYTHHNIVAGLYTGLLSVFGVTIFHEFLAQFEEGAEYVRRGKRPPWGLRWVTAPVSTFRGLIAWENFPPAEGTPITVLAGLANLERVRQIKRGIAEQRALERHENALAQARRRAELAGMKAAGTAVPASADTVPAVPECEFLPGGEPAEPIQQVELNPPTESTTPTEGAEPAEAKPSGERAQHAAASRPRARQEDSQAAEWTAGGGADVSVDESASEPKTPTQAATVAQWARLWVQMCADGDLVRGSLTNEEYARSVYRVSGRQLRAIRSAALSGRLARRASELGVELPDGFVSRPMQRAAERELLPAV